jgi:hypothetical protein
LPPLTLVVPMFSDCSCLWCCAAENISAAMKFGLFLSSRCWQHSEVPALSAHLLKWLLSAAFAVWCPRIAAFGNASMTVCVIACCETWL